MCHTIHLKMLALVNFFGLTLTLTWAKFENITQSVPLFALREYIWQVWGENAKFEALADPAFGHGGGGGHTSSATTALVDPEARFWSKRT